MRHLEVKALAIGAGLIFSTAVMADGMTHAQYEAREQSIRAELEARHEPTAKNAEGVRTAKVEATYSVAMERCEKRSGAADGACAREAKAARVHGLASTHQ
jgi:hypothetical protein